jgi:NAD(P)-dependent dehydrogenase (short-subunit alcohol dehydrogenase family)
MPTLSTTSLENAMDPLAQSLKGRTAIVSGGARGIGRAIAEDFLRCGANVVIVDSGVGMAGEPQEPNLADRVVADKECAAAVCGDIADPEVVRRAVLLARSRFGAVDILVNNAAILRDAMIFKASREDWDAVIRTNLSGAFQLLAEATPVMRDQVKAGRTPGSIINIVSSSGIYGNFGQYAYSASKAGMIGLTRAVAHDLARSGITCNAVAPFAATRVTESLPPANESLAAYKRRALSIPAIYVARLVSFLAAPASLHISGQLFAVRGRETMLCSQARPAVQVLQQTGGSTISELTEALGEFQPAYTALQTDIEAFGGDPVV